jgi:sigma54-dependent transcription regulator
MGLAPRDALLDEATRLLRQCARDAGYRPRAHEWREPLARLVEHFVSNQAGLLAVSSSRAERRREISRAITRLDRVAAGGKPRSNPIRLTDRAVDDVRLCWPNFRPALLHAHRPAMAERVALRLRRVRESLDGRFFGVASGPLGGDVALRELAAGVLDLLNDAQGRAQGTPASASPDGLWHRIVRLLAEAGGRAAKGGAEDRREALNAVRDALAGKEPPLRVIRRRTPD